jgi:sucrose-6-phosphate hydrolase SacC (GH32 family)
LINSGKKQTHFVIYTCDRYDSINNKWKPDNSETDVGIGLRYDWGIFYAAKTFFDPVKQRRILWGWIGEADSERSDIRKGWASLMVRTIYHFHIYFFAA